MQTHAHGAYASSSIGGAVLTASNSTLETGFIFEGATVRTIIVDGEPWFIGRDVAGQLGYADPVNAIKQHCKGVAKHHPLQTLGGVQNVRVLSEPDVLRLIVGSKLPAAARFERWVFEEVLPTIRRAGAYAVPAPVPSLNDPHALRSMLLGYTEKVIALQEQVVYLEPKAAALDRLASKKGSETISDAAKALRIRPSVLFAWLEKHKWTFKRHGSGPWRAMQDKLDNGCLVHVESQDRNRDDRTFTVCRVTPKGRARIAELIERENACT